MRRVFTWLLVFAAILGLSIGAAFGAGTAYGRATAPKATPSAAATPAAQAAGQSDLPGGSGQGGRAQMQGGQTGRQGTATVIGIVRSIEGQTLKLETLGGPETTITLSDSTPVGTVTTLDRSTLATGVTALVIGQRGADGNLTPTYILILPEGFTPR